MQSLDKVHGFVSPGVVLSVAFLMVLTAVCAYIVYQCFYHPLADFPGPFLAKLSRNWYAYKAKTSLWHQELMAMHAKYGGAVRVAPNEMLAVLCLLLFIPLARADPM